MRAEQLLTTSSKENIMTAIAGTVISTPRALFALPAGSVLVNKEDDYIYRVVKDRGQLFVAEYASFTAVSTYTLRPSNYPTLPNNINLTVLFIARS
jgi:hypothetical protein